MILQELLERAKMAPPYDDHTYQGTKRALGLTRELERQLCSSIRAYEATENLFVPVTKSGVVRLPPTVYPSHMEHVIAEMVFGSKNGLTADQTLPPAGLVPAQPVPLDTLAMLDPMGHYAPKNWYKFPRHAIPVFDSTGFQCGYTSAELVEDNIDFVSMYPRPYYGKSIYAMIDEAHQDLYKAAGIEPEPKGETHREPGQDADGRVNGRYL